MTATDLPGTAGEEYAEAAEHRPLATGELLVCPYCVAQWIVAGFAVGYVRAPRLTRLLAGMYTMYAISDGLQFAYLAADEKT